MNAKKTKTTKRVKTAKKVSSAASPMKWDGPFYNQFSCLMKHDSEIAVSEQPILPEFVAACLQNIAAYEHQTSSDTIEEGPSEFATKYLSRILREAPEVMAEAIKMQIGTAKEKLEQEAMYVARMIVVTTAQGEGDKVTFMPIKELFLALKTCHPKLYRMIPTGKRGQAYWLERAKLKFLPQSRRGKGTSPHQQELVKMIRSGFYPSEVKLTTKSR